MGRGSRSEKGSVAEMRLRFKMTERCKAFLFITHRDEWAPFENVIAAELGPEN